MNALVAVALLGTAALVSFPLRKRLRIAGAISCVAILAATLLLAFSPADATAQALELTFRVTPLGRLASLVLLATLLLLVLDVWFGEPAYNFFPTALGVGASTVGLLSLTSPLAIYAVLLLALLLPVGSFVFQVQRNRSVEAALRHFAFVALGGCLGIASLALAATLPKDQPATTFVLLLVVLVVAFALKLAAIPFHTHAALLVGEAPVAALALYFGVLVPATFLAFAQILTVSGLLPQVVQVQRIQDLLFGIGIVSAIGGSLLALGAADLRRLVVYSVIANLGAAVVGLSTLSGPGIVGGIAIAIVTGACATQQLLAAGALERGALPDETASAARAPLAAAAFIGGGAGMIGLPPLVGFPGHFFVELIAYAYSAAAGTALVLAALLLLVAQLRAGMTLFAAPVDTWQIEPRPVAGIIGGLIFAALLLGGILPDAFLRPIATFADEFIRALRPLT
ncbi:MAG TPA: proton-conducting transporter membrane subunit [Candidatus Limnocylindria bacterium]|nr:proton-conducting transporter membrane subunit [Candidatus Limnocylindria bacterium]